MLLVAQQLNGHYFTTGDVTTRELKGKEMPLKGLGEFSAVKDENRRCISKGDGCTHTYEVCISVRPFQRKCIFSQMFFSKGNE